MGLRFINIKQEKKLTKQIRMQLIHPRVQRPRTPKNTPKINGPTGIPISAIPPMKPVE